jgi:hypothetical protein
VATIDVKVKRITLHEHITVITERLKLPKSPLFFFNMPQLP